MTEDRYNLDLSTPSASARDAYVEGGDLLLTGYPGAIVALDRAIEIDPGFALAHVAKARALQGVGDVSSAKEALAAARACSDTLSKREVSHIDVFASLLSGPGDRALALVRKHLNAWPRDALVLSTTASQLGLIGLSGRAGREQELAAFLDGLASHYGDDWWFCAHHAMALSETSQQGAARPMIERSMSQNPRNAYAAHALCHVYYEMGEHGAAIEFLGSWLPAYPPESGLHGHLSWHLALSHLGSGNAMEGFRLFTEAFGADDCKGPALIRLADMASFLWRSELAGYPRDSTRWRCVHEFAHQMFPEPGVPMADWHVALADAVAGDSAKVETCAEKLETMLEAGRFPCGPAVPALLRGLAAFERHDYDAAIDAIEPMLPERERIGGSRAQVDLVEFTLMKAYLNADRPDEARRLLDERRPGPTRVVVAGMEAIH